MAITESKEFLELLLNDTETEVIGCGFYWGYSLHTGITKEGLMRWLHGKRIGYVIETSNLTKEDRDILSSGDILWIKQNFQRIINQYPVYYPMNFELIKPDENSIIFQNKSTRQL